MRNRKKKYRLKDIHNYKKIEYTNNDKKRK